MLRSGSRADRCPVSSRRSAKARWPYVSSWIHGTTSVGAGDWSNEGVVFGAGGTPQKWFVPTLKPQVLDTGLWRAKITKRLRLWVISRGTRGNALPIVEKIPERTHFIWRTNFRPKEALDCRIFHVQSKKNSGVISPDSRYRRGPRPGAWTQTQITAWLASVPIVHVWRNDHSLTPQQQPSVRESRSFQI